MTWPMLLLDCASNHISFWWIIPHSIERGILSSLTNTFDSRVGALLLWGDMFNFQNINFHGANMGPTWVLSAPCWPHEPCYQGSFRPGDAVKHHSTGSCSVQVAYMISSCYVSQHCVSVNILMPEYGSGHGGVAVLLPGFAISWYQNQVTRQPHLRDLTHMHLLM